jgi:hypothetical protein
VHIATSLASFPSEGISAWRHVYMPCLRGNVTFPRDAGGFCEETTAAEPGPRSSCRESEDSKTKYALPVDNPHASLVDKERDE